MNLDFLQQVYWGNTVELYLRFAVILLLALLLKRYISSIFTRLFYTVFRKFSSDYFGQQFRELLLRPVEGLIVTIFFYIAFYQLSISLDKVILFRRMKPIKEAGKEVATTLVTIMDIIDHLFFLFLLFYFVLLISRLLDFIFMVLVSKAKDRDDRERQQVLPLLKDVLKVIVWAFGVLSVLGAVFHVNVAALVAGLGVGGIAIAFAAKESLENLLASFMVMIDKPFTIGDWVKIDGVEGNIEKVGFRSTRIRTFDKSVISIPNRQLIDNSLENFSERGMRRVVFSVGAVYGLSVTTLETTMQEIRNVVLKTEGTTGNPSVQLESLGASSVNLQVIYFVAVNSTVDFGKVRERVYLGVYETMYRYAKGFAYPTQFEISGPEVNEVFPQTPQPPEMQ
ncbi:mechanosensitive ion channel family protein [Taibaiella koreensis]|uniref:mechanosensitive ion channel family protein n=1 Tax=Taibaiella koreensis TaxID=1268548 RepID=UPI000E59E424|nr:mechanosensitive ion channel family protein [Taibaiella koreensis]